MHNNINQLQNIDVIYTNIYGCIWVIESYESRNPVVSWLFWVAIPIICSEIKAVLLADVYIFSINKVQW